LCDSSKAKGEVLYSKRSVVLHSSGGSLSQGLTALKRKVSWKSRAKEYHRDTLYNKPHRRLPRRERSESVAAEAKISDFKACIVNSKIHRVHRPCLKITKNLFWGQAYSIHL
jgi:ribosomal protein S21